MVRFTSVWVVALCMPACVAHAQATVYSYTLDALASGDRNGPIHGTLKIDLSRVAFSYPISAPGGSRLDIRTFAVFAHGASGVQDFVLSFVSPTSALHDDLSHFPMLTGGVSGSGSYDLSYSGYPGAPERRVHFTFVVTAVPEGAPLALALGGLCIVPLMGRRGLHRRS